jgi:hypothetical protein
MNIKIIDNFLPKSEFEFLQTEIMSDRLSWYYNDFEIVPTDRRYYQYTHTLYNEGYKSDAYSLMNPILNELNISKLIRIKANSNFRSIFKRKKGFHVDPWRDCKTSIYYLNDNNGGTKFKNGKFYRSVANRMIIFDSNLIHTGISCTDKKRRVVLNFNYY